MSIEEQRAYVKIETLRGTSPTTILLSLEQVCGESALSRERVFEGAKRFREGRETIEDDPRPGRPTTTTDPKHVHAVRF